MNDYTIMNAKLNALHQIKQIRQSMSPSVSVLKRKYSLENQSGLKKLRGGKKRTKKTKRKNKATKSKRSTAKRKSSTAKRK